jgi:hypothetical protein
MWRLNFGELMRFLPDGLNPFKIQRMFKVDLFLNFIIQNLERFWSLTKKESYSIWSSISTCQILKFLEFCKYRFLILQIWIIWIFENSLDEKKKESRLSPDEQCRKVQINSAENSKNYRIFRSNLKTDHMEAQLTDFHDTISCFHTDYRIYWIIQK